MNPADISVDITPVSSSKSKVTVALGRGTKMEQRVHDRVFRSTGSLIGANTLSIIGQIEPGRTVRLYRQIH